MLGLSTTWRSTIWNEEIQNTHCSSHNGSWSCWKIFNGQIKLSVGEYICVASWRWRTIFMKNATQEVAKNLKNWKRSCCQEENTVKQRRLEEFLTQHGQESRTVSLLRDQVSWFPELLKFIEDSKIFYDPNSPSSSDSTNGPHQALITSSSRTLSCDVGMLPNTREDVSIPGNVFDCQHARRDPDEWHNDSENRRNWEKWERRTIAINTFILFSNRKQDKSLNGGKCPMSMTNHAAGIGTCTQGMTIPSCLSS